MRARWAGRVWPWPCAAAWGALAAAAPWFPITGGEAAFAVGPAGVLGLLLGWARAWWALGASAVAALVLWWVRFAREVGPGDGGAGAFVFFLLLGVLTVLYLHLPMAVGAFAGWLGRSFRGVEREGRTP
ncbi:hypothetical protein [Kitasatospora terrestris]|uniref:Uncharacterized protein n=1 Tax=Kitasatospora terrestris TaxID=258051 RepID=A0ABP9EAB4_9ACTN